MPECNFIVSRATLAILWSCAMTGSAQASFAWFNNNFAGWQSAAGEFNTCDFAAYPTNTFITDQYADLGVLFTNPGPNVVHANDFAGFPLDGHGIDGNCGIELTFLQPTYSVGAHGPGLWTYDVYAGNTLLYSSPGHAPSLNGFAGFVSTVPFDRVVFWGLIPPNCEDDVYIDNIYFSTVPAPAASIFVVMGLVAGKRRRRV